MSILWVGTSLADLLIKGSAILNPTSGDISVNVAEGFYLNKEGDADSFSPKFLPQTDLWASQTLKCGSELYSTNAVLWKWVAPSGDDFLRIVMHATGPMCKLQLKTAANTWTDLATALFGLSTARVRIDFHIIVGSSGKFTMWVDGVPCIDFEGNTVGYGGAASISYMVFGGHYVAHISTHSAIMIANEDTRTMIFYQRLPTGNGTETDWTGSYSDVDETSYNDADFIEAAASGDTETFTYAALPGGVDAQQLVSLIVAGRTKSSGALQEIVGAAKVSGTVYEADAQFPSSPLYLPQQWQFPLNPATSAPWLGSEVNAAEFGVKVA